MYSESYRMSFLANCSRTWSVHPAIREATKTGVNKRLGMSR
jgi:hypothetical protein